MNNYDKVFYTLKYVSGYFPTSQGIIELSQTEKGKFALEEWIMDLYYNFKEYRPLDDDEIRKKIKEFVFNRSGPDVEIEEYVRDIYVSAEFDNDKKQIMDCYIEWIRLADEMFDE